MNCDKHTKNSEEYFRCKVMCAIINDIISDDKYNDNIQLYLNYINLVFDGLKIRKDLSDILVKYFREKLLLLDNKDVIKYHIPLIRGPANYYKYNNTIIIISLGMPYIQKRKILNNI